MTTKFVNGAAGLFALTAVNVSVDKKKKHSLKERLSWDKWTDGKGKAILPFSLIIPQWTKEAKACLKQLSALFVVRGWN